ncbi:peptidylprolyl isomerase [Chromobacterium subtsugae]|uniref:peptidylprolyl isomerase n=1 Tax=Chromobacterium subtsugae TaxID=251747 RepID=A0ABS7FIA9_9NEIS|nr:MULTISPECIES: peptidylprolyl isomerase [Chromobacterium]KUM04685.1 peptidylprolyl isomerase [Chromobacterium subtsugae]KZE84686.1 peptidylprolyl isomerase [Chromobacterium sp. F49]MBW7567489.1 peptidylprolyl isomerase [Chromobacterium subtsugae]MBW8289815.1 peptidylprolyl isomerase [Chromobacterium subtsugae]OBU87612.1 peptidylprolyl isomerase [Chromobacterium subtsugae]
MKITANTAVTLRMKVTDSQGLVYDDGKHPIAYLHGDYDNLFPKLEAALEGQEPGFQITVDLAAEDAFGERDEALATTMAKADFPPGIKVGGQIQRPGPDGQPRYYFVTKIKGPTVLLDGNHPLCGKNLRFALKVVDVREATAEEIAHQHVHGEHGHQH